MPVYHVRHEAESYGQALGLLLTRVAYPFIPGDPGHAARFRHPVPYEELAEVSQASVLAAARRLAAQGVRAIGAASGRLLPFQDAVRRAVGVPGCLSAQLQLPMLAASLGPQRSILVLSSVADPVAQVAASLRPRLTTVSPDAGPDTAAPLPGMTDISIPARSKRSWWRWCGRHRRRVRCWAPCSCRTLGYRPIRPRSKPRPAFRSPIW